MNAIEEIFNNAESPADYAQNYANHMCKVMEALDNDAVAELIGLVEAAAVEDKSVIICANGGSASVATHYVNDLSANSVIDGQPGYRVISLTDNSSSLTALGNDASFDQVFEIQLKANMRAGDLVIFMSVSGNSPNLVRGIEYANANGAKTVACTGMMGGKLKDLAQLSIHTPSTADEYGPIEDIFSVIMHSVTSYIIQKRGRRLAH